MNNSKLAASLGSLDHRDSARKTRSRNKLPRHGRIVRPVRSSCEEIRYRKGIRQRICALVRFDNIIVDKELIVLRLVCFVHYSLSETDSTIGV